MSNDLNIHICHTETKKNWSFCLQTFPWAEMDLRKCFAETTKDYIIEFLGPYLSYLGGIN